MPSRVAFSRSPAEKIYPSLIFNNLRELPGYPGLFERYPVAESKSTFFRKRPIPIAAPPAPGDWLRIVRPPGPPAIGFESSYPAHPRSSLRKLASNCKAAGPPAIGFELSYPAHPRSSRRKLASNCKARRLASNRLIPPIRVHPGGNWLRIVRPPGPPAIWLRIVLSRPSAFIPAEIGFEL
jgi:hypothetical protein